MVPTTAKLADQILAHARIHRSVPFFAALATGMSMRELTAYLDEAVETSDPDAVAHPLAESGSQGEPTFGGALDFVLQGPASLLTVWRQHGQQATELFDFDALYPDSLLVRHAIERHRDAHREGVRLALAVKTDAEAQADVPDGAAGVWDDIACMDPNKLGVQLAHAGIFDTQAAFAMLLDKAPWSVGDTMKVGGWTEQQVTVVVTEILTSVCARVRMVDGSQRDEETLIYAYEPWEKVNLPFSEPTPVDDEDDIPVGLREKNARELLVIHAEAYGWDVTTNNADGLEFVRSGRPGRGEEWLHCHFAADEDALIGATFDSLLGGSSWHSDLAYTLREWVLIYLSMA